MSNGGCVYAGGSVKDKSAFSIIDLSVQLGKEKDVETEQQQ